MQEIKNVNTIEGGNGGRVVVIVWP